MVKKNFDVLIIGGGMVGLSIAHQLKIRNLYSNIAIIEKESEIGLHSSGRNSGVLHAGIYYEPNSLKAKVCVSGSQRLKEWVTYHKLNINKCGKIIVPQAYELDDQIDNLLKRGISNGAKVEVIDQKTLTSIIPEASSATGRALWSPETSVVNPKEVIKKLESILREWGVNFFLEESNWKLNLNKREILLKDSSHINYGNCINCSGLNADIIAKKFGVGNEYKMIPFKGIYWNLKKESNLKIKTNLYPVPDINMPFLGVHFTPNCNPYNEVTIGPTATPALGRENYYGIENFEPINTIKNLSFMSRQYLENKNGIRKYVNEQMFLSIPYLFLKSAQKLIPSLKKEDIYPSKKVGIRPQLCNLINGKIEKDFICKEGPSSIHILNAISPAFTASFSFADLIIDNYLINKK